MSMDDNTRMQFMRAIGVVHETGMSERDRPQCIPMTPPLSPPSSQCFCWCLPSWAPRRCSPRVPASSRRGSCWRTWQRTTWGAWRGRWRGATCWRREILNETVLAMHGVRITTAHVYPCKVCVRYPFPSAPMQTVCSLPLPPMHPHLPSLPSPTQAVLAVCPAPLHSEFVARFVVGRAPRLARHPHANFVLQAALSSTPSQADLEAMVRGREWTGKDDYGFVADDGRRAVLWCLA